MRLSLSHLVLDRPLAVIDLETTGVDPATDRIVEAAVLTLFPGGEQELFHRRVNPGVPIPAGATAVHGMVDPIYKTKKPPARTPLSFCPL